MKTRVIPSSESPAKIPRKRKIKTEHQEEQQPDQEFIEPPPKVHCENEIPQASDMMDVTFRETEDNKPIKRGNYYVNKFRKEWLSEPKFTDWIGAVANDRTKAFCQYCLSLLRAHRTDLLNHVKTKKHIRNANLCKTSENWNSETTPLPEDEPYIFVKGSDEDVNTAHLLHVDDANDGFHSPLFNTARRAIMRDVDYILSNKKDEISYLAACRADEGDENQAKKVGRICVAYLSQKYQIDSAIEAAQNSQRGATKAPNQFDQLSTEISELRKQLGETLSNFTVVEKDTKEQNGS